MKLLYSSIRRPETLLQNAPSLIAMEKARAAGMVLPVVVSPWEALWKRLTGFWRALRVDKFAMAGLVCLLLLVVVASWAGFLAPHDPTWQTLGKRLVPGVWSSRGTWAFPLGTDHLGRDVLSRLLFGSRISLVVGLISRSPPGDAGPGGGAPGYPADQGGRAEQGGKRRRPQLMRQWERRCGVAEAVRPGVVCSAACLSRTPPGFWRSREAPLEEARHNRSASKKSPLREPFVPALAR
jgi:hypothetical protein